MRGTRIFRALFPFSLPIIAIPVIAMMFIQFQDCYISSSGYLECFTNLVSSLSWNSRVKQWQDVNDEEFKKRYEEMESSFRVFVYPEGDPKTYYQTPGELSGPYASEGYFFKNIMESPLRTENPDEATMFFIPISVQKMSAKGLPIRKMRNVVKKYIEEISSKYPYWDRNFGMDHFFVSCHEMGLNVTQGVQHLVRHAIRVVCFPNKKDGYVRAKDLTLPQLLLPFVNHAAGTDTKMRTRLSLLAGQDSTEADLDFLISRRISMPRKRTEANVLWTPNYYKTKFCLCPGGSQMDNARIADAIHYGCVPVIWPDHNDLPLSGIIRWELFSLKLKEDIVYFVEVEESLQSISDAEYKARQNNTVKVQLHFQWNSPPLRYDAFHFIMLQLFERYMDRRHAFELAKATKIDWCSGSEALRVLAPDVQS